MFCIRLGIALSIAISIVSSTGQLHLFGKSVKWCNALECNYEGTHSGVTPVGRIYWKYTTSNNGDVELAFWCQSEGAGINERAQEWKENQECYQAVTSIKLNNIESIYGNAFMNMQNLKTVDLSGVRVVGKSCFEGCSLLSDLGVGDFTASPSHRSFYGCSALQLNLKLSENISYISDSAFEGSGLRGVNATAVLEPLSISDMAFKNCKFLTSFHIDQLVLLGESCFEGCSSLTDFFLNSSAELTTIRGRAFFGCVELEFDLECGPKFGSLGNDAFRNCQLMTINTSDAAEQIGIFSERMFMNSPNLTNVVFGPNLCVYPTCFEGCTQLQNVTCSPITYGRYYIESRAFFGCIALEAILDGSRFIPTGGSVFEGSGLIGMTNCYAEGKDSYSTPPQSTFKDCVKLEYITFSENSMSIPPSMFEGCLSLTSVTVPVHISSFGDFCFRDCKSLKVFTYQGYSNAPSNIFDGCDALTNVNLPKDYRHSSFAGFRVLPYGAKIGIGIGVALFVIIVVVVVFVVLRATGKIGKKKEEWKEQP